MRRLLAVLFLDIFVFLLIFLPLHRDYKKVVLGQKRMEEERVSLEKKLEDLRKKEKTLIQQMSSLEEFRRKNLFIGDSGVVAAREIIRKAFSRAGISFQGLTFSNPSEPISGYYKIGISIPPVIATYGRLRRLIYELETSPKMIVIKSITMKRIGGGKIRALINLEAYFHEG